MITGDVVYEKWRSIFEHKAIKSLHRFIWNAANSLSSIFKGSCECLCNLHAAAQSNYSFILEIELGFCLHNYAGL